MADKRIVMVLELVVVDSATADSLIELLEEVLPSREDTGQILAVDRAYEGFQLTS